MKAVLGLENGEYIIGDGFGAEGTTAGELVFTTQMGGYMEALTDPSYAGQILMFTYPLIGNYGVDEQNFQSPHVNALGCVVNEICQRPSSNRSLSSFFEENNLFGISGVDTRKLTIDTRVNGTLRAALITGDDNGEYAVECAKKVKPISETDLLSQVSCKEPYRIPGKGKRIAVIDLGIKKNIAVSLRKRGADLYMFPHNSSPSDIEACEPEAIFITNGPGDPVLATDAVKCAKHFIGQMPVFGICMGNQVLGRAFGAETYKMKFGHRGSNQPVRHHDGSIYITTQNHGFAVDGDTLPEDCEIYFSNVNDGSLEGFFSKDLDVYCVQFHPEAHGGPWDTEKTIFDFMYRRIP
ncbi:glutamine-hydrolyzing carbamoyl-phosphate synthase small subunit [Methanoplanus sp. FWC-SCC4]|uniref:Carbamoyl phosphate synthase small chain n=1 Tax=Methanochimaera problematica TaxID=2609417 RepID=A0AA97I3Q7_9EURY|nr:glutamine-hydrolyzing carbamoyl-phosphate synthase small subunit [Methanoplanus sp. FWC-SCC4]WOF16151.1 glutamine-hydrolyzing carbamoyl-phosphate synthase small subunit [Methanoplanus sp. FWC-SCC4]